MEERQNINSTVKSILVIVIKCQMNVYNIAQIDVVIHTPSLFLKKLKFYYCSLHLAIDEALLIWFKRKVIL